jgi:GNAT superfamily N-acetyltransferase
LLQEGEGVTLSRSDAHYVVTEFGTANLLGKSISERALELIEIAHPAHRGWLLSEAKRLRYLPDEQYVSSAGAYPVEEARELMIAGHTLSVRPARASDGDGIRGLFHSLSEEDVYTRFFARLACLSFADEQRLVNVDHANEVAFVVFEPSSDSDRIIATASYFRTHCRESAEVAYMIQPEWQGKGLGRALQSLLLDHGKRHGLVRFVAEVQRSNRKMVELARSSGVSVNVESEDDTLIITMEL